MEQESPDKLIGRQSHGLLLVVAVVLPTESHMPRIDIQETIIGDGDAVGVATNIVEHLLRTSKGPLRIDHPFFALHRSQIAGESQFGFERLERRKESQLARVKSLLQIFQEQAAKQSGQDADRQEKIRSA